MEDYPCNFDVVGQIKERKPNQSGGDGVYRVLDKRTGENKILKYFYSDEFGPSNPNEIAIASTFRHPNIISTRLLISNECNIKGFGEIVDLAQITYQDYIDNLTTLELKLTSILRILYAIQFMHRQGYLHLDIKYDNIVVLNGMECVTDFGNSVRCRDVKKGVYLNVKHHIGTITYMSPEIYRQNPSEPILYTNAVDIWALGHLIFAIFFGGTIHPVELYIKMLTPGGKQEITKINDMLVNPEYVNVRVDTEGKGIYSDDVLKMIKVLLNSIWKEDPTKRPSISQIIGFPLFNFVRAQNQPPEGNIFQMNVKIKPEQAIDIVSYIKLILSMGNTFRLTHLPFAIITTAVDLYYRTYHSTLNISEGVNILRRNLAYACFYISLRAHMLTDYDIYNSILDKITEGPDYFSRMLYNIYIILKGDINRYSYYQLCEGASHVKYLLTNYILYPPNYIPCDFIKFKQELASIPVDEQPDMSIVKFSTYINPK